MVIDLTKYGCGFCDRMRFVTFCMAVAYYRNDKILFFKEKTNEQCPFLFLDLIQVRGFECKPWSEAAGKAEWEVSHWSAPDFMFAKNLKPKELSVSTQDFFGTWIKAYQWFYPKQEISIRLDNLMQGKECIGLHIRKTDRKSRNMQEIRLMEKRIEKDLRRSSEKFGIKNVFLACDNRDSKLEWERKIKEMGLVVISNPSEFNSSNLRQTSGNDFITDLFALSRCKVLIKTSVSAVVKSAAAMGAISRNRVIDSYTFYSLPAFIINFYLYLKQKIRLFLNLRKITPSR